MFAFLRGFAVGLEEAAAGYQRHLIPILSLCFGGGVTGFASDSGLELSPALSSRLGVASALPGLRMMAVCGGTHELWLWGTLGGTRGWESTGAAAPHPGAPGGSVSQGFAVILDVCLQQLRPRMSPAALLTLPSSTVAPSTVPFARLCAPSHAPKPKLEHSFLLLPTSWGLGWRTPPCRKVCIKVKLLVATWKAASVSRKAWPFSGP